MTSLQLDLLGIQIIPANQLSSRSFADTLVSQGDWDPPLAFWPGGSSMRLNILNMTADPSIKLTSKSVISAARYLPLPLIGDDPKPTVDAWLCGLVDSDFWWQTVMMSTIEEKHSEGSHYLTQVALDICLPEEFTLQASLALSNLNIDQNMLHNSDPIGPGSYRYSTSMLFINRERLSTIGLDAALLE